MLDAEQIEAFRATFGEAAAAPAKPAPPPAAEHLPGSHNPPLAAPKPR